LKIKSAKELNNMGKYDLHIHTKYSPDADLPVSEIIDICTEKNMHTVALTDHNSVAASTDFFNSNIKTDITVIPGIELDCSYQGITFHMLGYNIDYSSNDFIEWQKEFTRREMDAVPMRIKKLQNLGMIIDENEVYEKAGGMIPQEELMAEIVLENKENHSHPLLQSYLPDGEKSDMPFIHFFWDIFGHNKPAHVPIEYLDAITAVDLIKSNGGTPILSHPGANFNDDLALIDEIIGMGLSGIEVYSNYHSKVLTSKFKKYALDMNLMITCGSDFHGRNKPLIKIGSCSYPNEDEALIIETVNRILT
jgi:3',5'-nucleoside bisphosphate phosphatase